MSSILDPWDVMAVGIKSRWRFLRSDDDGEHLLPGIPNEITLDYITPKLPWPAVQNLSSVSRCWQEAIRSRRVYDARVRARSTETLVCITRLPFLNDSDYEDCQHGCTYAISLYSMREKSCYQLPPIPHLETGIPWECQCIALDGRIYVLGGVEGIDSELGSAKVYVLDAAGERQWKPCSSMQDGRCRFGCGVLDGKIYVFGGTSRNKPVRGSEVYDPSANAWSPIMPMKAMRFDNHVATIGGELFVFGGRFYDREVLEPAAGDGDELFEHMHSAWDSEIYHPALNKWRVVERFGRHERGSVFMAKGEFYLMKADPFLGINVFDFDKISWTNRHISSLAALGSVSHDPYATLAVNDEIVAVVYERNSGKPDNGVYLLQSIGFDRESNQIVWQKSNCSISLHVMERVDMCPIQL